MNISQHQIDNLVNKANIVDIIGKYLHIQKKGKNYVAVCPFHDDSDPSLTISPDKKIFKCFVCGTGGNIISFLQEFNNITFFKALTLLSEELNIKIEGLKNFNEKPKYNDEEIKILQINKDAALFFNAMLITKYGIEATTYLKNRTIDKNEISKFLIGFAPKEVNLKNFLLKKRYKEQDILNSKLTSLKEVNEWNFFENRIIFPITDEDDNVIGFSGRTINDTDKPKYKNSIESLVFKKSQLVYNYSNAKNHIRSSNEIVILEGFMDVISLERIEIKNSIAIMGTTLSDYHIKLFSKLTKNFKLFLDGDKAGVNASLKNAMMLMDININVTIIENNTGKDPDELVRDGDQNLIKKMIDSARHPIDFALDYFGKKIIDGDLTSLKINTDIIKEVISHEKNSIIRASAINRLAKILNTPREQLEQEIKTPSIVEVINPNESYNFEPNLNNNFIVDDSMYINSLNDENDSFIFYADNQNQDIKRNEIENTDQQVLEKLNSSLQRIIAHSRMKISEALLILQLIYDSSLVEEIKKRIDLFSNQNVQIIARIIIDMYENESYQGNDFEKVSAKLILMLGSKAETLFEIRNKLESQRRIRYSSKGIQDMFNKITIYRLWDDFDTKIRNINSLSDIKAKKILHKMCEDIMIKIRKIENERG